ncbi:MAG: hypothetical protein GF315_13725 [candidate division Zixibacteria bacterium]|nr:hypothetical protein [candidate division Zixibacteria bacterium]
MDNEAKIKQLQSYDFRKLVEDSLIGILLIEGSEIIYRNAKAAEIFGDVDLTDILFECSYVHPDDCRIVADTAEIISKGLSEPIDLEFSFYSKDEEQLKWVSCRISNLPIADKDLLMIETLDLTVRKQLEKAVRLKDRVYTLGRLTAGIAHQIRSPLSGVNIYLDILKKKLRELGGKKEDEAAIDKIELATQKIEDSINKLMHFAKTGATIQMSVNINTAIREVLKISETSLKPAGIEVRLNLDKNLPAFTGDSDTIERVIMNLIINAKDAMESIEGEKLLEISTYSEGGKIIIRVADSGPGIPNNIRESIFQPFFSTKQSGTGIGLSLNYTAITEYGGKITVGTSAYGGAEFNVILPVKEESQQDG